MTDFRPAAVPYGGPGDGVAAPTTQAPDDILSVRATPDAFGAQVGQSEERTGQQTQQAGQDFAQIALMKAQQANELITNDANTRTGRALAQTWGKFSSLEGKAAVAGLPDFQQAVEDHYNSALATMPNPAAKSMLSQSLRYLADAYQRYGQNYADQQQRTWQDKSRTDAANEFANQAVLASNQDDTHISTLINAGAGNIVAMYEPRYFGDPHNLVPMSADDKSQARDAINGEVAKYKGAAYLGVVKSMVDQGNTDGALAVFDKHRSEMDAASQTAIDGFLKGNATTLAARDIVAKRWPGLTGGVDASAPPQAQLASAILGQESGNNPTAPTSVDGAMGPGQIKPSTFAQFAKPGENIDNPTDNAAVSQRIVQNYYQQYGGDAARVAVAYFSGPGNVAGPDSPTPWIKDTADGNGKTVSSYVGDVTGRLNKAGILADKAAVLNTIDRDYGNQPQLATAMREYVTRQITDQTLQVQAQQQAQLANQNAAMDDYLRPAMKGQNVQGLVQKLADDPRLTSESREHLYNALQTIGQGKAYGTDFYSLLARVHSTGPGQISNPDDLLKETDGNRLTLDGLDKLRGELAGKGTPDADATTGMKKAALDYAKHQISFEADYGSYKLPDPKGEDSFNVGFIPAFYKAYDAGIKDGKTPYQLLSRDSPDFIVDKVIAPYKRSDAQVAADKMNQASELPADVSANVPAPTKQIEQASSLQDLVQMVQHNPWQRDQAVAYAIQKGWIRKNDASSAPSVPIAQP